MGRPEVFRKRRTKDYLLRDTPLSQINKIERQQGLHDSVFAERHVTIFPLLFYVLILTPITEGLSVQETSSVKVT